VLIPIRGKCYLLTPWRRVHIEKLTGSQLVKKFLALYRTEKFVGHSQVPATWSYPEPDQSSPCPPSHYLKIHLNIILPSTPGISKGSFPLRFPHQNLICTSPLPIRATCPSHLILLDFITRIIFCEVYRSLGSSL